MTVVASEADRLREGAAAPPPRPDLTRGGGAPAARHRRRWPWVVAALVALNAVVVALVVNGRGGTGMPAEIAGVQRLDTDAARSFEDLVSAIHAGGLSLRGAMYGSGGRPELILERIVGTDEPFQGLPVETVLGQAGGFGIGTGGQLDEEATVSASRDGTDYACAPVRGTGIPDTDGTGVLCVFSGRAAGVLFDLRTSVPTDAIDDAEAARDAILGAG